MGGLSAHRCAAARDARFVVVALGAYPVEELAAGAEVEDEVEVVRGLEWAGLRIERGTYRTESDLEIVVQCHDIWVSLRDTLQDRNFVAHLWNDTSERVSDIDGISGASKRTIYSRPSMSFLLMTLQAKYSPVLMCTASLTMAYVPLPRVLPVRY